MHAFAVRLWQVTSSIVGAMVWAVEHQGQGIVAPDSVDFRRVLEVATPYLGRVVGHYTEWNPLYVQPARGGLVLQTCTLVCVLICAVVRPMTLDTCGSGSAPVPHAWLPQERAVV